MTSGYLRHPRTVHRTDPARQLEQVLAIGLVLVIALRYRLSPDVPVGFLLAAAMLPVTIRAINWYRGIQVILVLVVLATVSGLVLTWVYSTSGEVNHSVLIVQTARVLGLGLATLALLWARTVLGTRRMVFAFAIGTFVSLVTTVGINDSNIWKFSLSVPVILLALSLPGVYRRRPAEVAALLVLATISATSNSRSSAAMLLIAAGLVTTQGTLWDAPRSRTSGAVVAVFRIAAFGLGVYYLVRAAALEGILGEVTQERTAAQLQATGSVILGGRPEVGASLALIGDRITGYGAGSLPSPSQVLSAREGMRGLGQTPDSGYVQNYMFGNGFELHSVLGDLWVLFGLAGMVLAVAVVGYAVMGAAHALSHRVAPAVTLFLTIRLVWDFAFSPFASAMLTLPLALAVVLVKRDEQPVRHP